jgi:citrate synthase
VTLLAKVPTLIATSHRLRLGLAPIPPRDDLPLAGNFFHMCLGRVPHPDVVKAFDVSLTLYAEHGFNCSTFAARVVASSLSDSCSAVVAGIGALKGPLHGGANEAVMRMLVEIGDPSRAEAWLQAALGARRKVMGFGHRLYKHGDSRVPAMDRWGRKVAEHCGVTVWHRIEDVLAAGMLARTGIRPNLDFPSAPAFHLMGFETDLYTPIFAMARLVGWTAHIVEQAGANRLIRPASAYVGQAERHVVPLATRVRLRAA